MFVLIKEGTNLREARDERWWTSLNIIDGGVAAINEKCWKIGPWCKSLKKLKSTQALDSSKQVVIVEAGNRWVKLENFWNKFLTTDLKAYQLGSMMVTTCSGRKMSGNSLGDSATEVLALKRWRSNTVESTSKRNNLKVLADGSWKFETVTGTKVEVRIYYATS